jgi:RNA recognition motif-containing protein
VVYLPPEPKKDEPEDLESAIFVGNIPVSYKHKDLKKLFSSYGKIEKVWFRSVPVEQNKLGKKANFILKNLQEGADAMNGYVKFAEKESAEQACQVNGTKVEDHTLRVFLCLDSNLDYETTVFVGNLHLEVREEELRQHFEHIGEVVNVRVIKDKTTFKGIGIGYVRFANKQGTPASTQTCSPPSRPCRALYSETGQSESREPSKSPSWRRSSTA